MVCKKIGWDQIGSEGRWLTGGWAPPQTPRARVPLLQGRARRAKGHGRGTPRCLLASFILPRTDWFSPTRGHSFDQDWLLSSISHSILVKWFCQASIGHSCCQYGISENDCIYLTIQLLLGCFVKCVENVWQKTNLKLGSLSRNELGLLAFRTDSVWIWFHCKIFWTEYAADAKGWNPGNKGWKYCK